MSNALSPADAALKGKRDYWLDDVVREQNRTINYAEMVILSAEVEDIGGIRRATEREIMHLKLSMAALKEIEALDAKEKAARALVPERVPA